MLMADTVMDDGPSMAHYPLYTQNLSLVGVCVKRIGKECSIRLKSEFCD